MATAVSNLPSAPRMKRPPLPNVQTVGNGPRPSPAAQSPGTPSKRPPSASGSVPSATTTNASAPHPRGPIRRTSQRPSETNTRMNRIGKSGEQMSSPQRSAEPYVKTSEYILSKYGKKPPSLVIHLHPTHFRFDQQDGSWSYQSQMKLILEHVQQQTIPHDLVDQLLRSGITFYDGCLIVQVRDHRHTAAIKSKGPKDVRTETNQPFSMHKHSKFLVPSPYVPYPLPKQLSPDNPNSEGPHCDKVEEDKAQVKPKQDGEVRSEDDAERTYTTVLFPTVSNLSQELIDYAVWADNMTFQRNKARAMAQKPVGQQAQVGAPPAKRQKLLSDNARLQDFEAKVVSAIAPPLFLDPVEDMDQAQELLSKLRDPRFNEEPPVPKSRKRTRAELAADEALAAEEQRFMLIMDERLQNSASAGASADTETGAASFEPRFERFKAIEEIRRQHDERQREEAEAKAHAQAEKERVLRERQAQDSERQKQSVLQARQQQQNRAAQLAAQQNLASTQHPHGHLGGTTGTMSNNAQPYPAVAGHQGSPAMRTMTPQGASSPVTGNAMAASRSNQGSAPMAINTSRQGSGSPHRPGSALQHAHQGGMIPPQQPPSRHGTPHLPGNTPRMQTSTPVMHNVTNTPRIGGASPAITTVAGTPVQANAMIAKTQVGNRPMSQQQIAAIQAQQNNIRQQQLFRQQQHLQQQAAMARGQGSPSMMQVNAAQQQQQQQQQQLAQRAQQQAQMRAGGMPQDGAFRQQFPTMVGNIGQNGQVLGGTNLSGHHQQQHQQNPGQQMAQPGPQIPANQTQYTMMANRIAQTIFLQSKQAAVSNGQAITPDFERSLQMQATMRARAILKQRLDQQKMQRQQQIMVNGMNNAGAMGLNNAG